MKLKHYLEIKDLKVSEFPTDIEYIIEVVSILLDLPIEEVEEYSYTYLLEKFNEYKLLDYSHYKEEVKVEGKRLNLIPLNLITLGEWIDLNYFTKSIDTLPELLAVMYRFKTPTDEWEEDKYEEYGLYVNKRSKLFLDVNIKEVIGVRKHFIDYKNNILERYSLLFNKDSEEELENLTQSELEEYKRLVKLEESQNQFVWEQLLLQLSNRDISKVDKLLKTNFNIILNMLSVIKLEHTKKNKQNGKQR